MYDIRQFRPTLYLLLIVGVSGFALAASAPGLWVLSLVAVLFNAHQVRRGTFTPLPRLVASAVTLAALAYVITQFRSAETPMLVIGQFLVLLQLVKLYEQRGNRDLGQLLVLSLLLMVAASLNTASLMFAILLVSYLFISLYCCLLFHLKVETDQAREAMSLREDQANPATLRQDQRYLSGSMMRLTGLVATVSISLAVVVFLFFPRNPRSGLLASLEGAAVTATTGISEQVNFQQIARITVNNEAVARVWVWKNDKPNRGGTLLLRSLTLDRYSGRANGKVEGQWRWSRGDEASAERYYNQYTRNLPANRKLRLPPDSGSTSQFPESAKDTWRQKVILQPTGTRYLFALAGPFQFTPISEQINIRYSDRDESIASVDKLRNTIEYEVLSHNQSLPADEDNLRDRPSRSDIDPKIRAYARDAKVSGADARGNLLADQRPRNRLTSDLDATIASNIERHLHREFSYTLDLTDAKRISDEDPVVAFLYTLKRGHCEYFAGAMTLLCQSLGMQARMVVGFKCDDFNPLLESYQVNQSQAHAWVEVLTPQGWRTYDPTTDTEAPERPANAWQKAKNLYDYLDYQWATSVVAYDNARRDHLLEALDNMFVNMLIDVPRRFERDVRRLQNWLDFAPQAWFLRSYFIGSVVALLLLALLWAIANFLWERWILRRRAIHLGIESLPTADQLRLARQLGFYEDMTRLLQRHRLYRPRHQTPLEFSRSLAFLPPEAYSLIYRLTKVFYRIRFGQAELEPSQQRRLRAVLERLGQRLSGLSDDISGSSVSSASSGSSGSPGSPGSSGTLSSSMPH